MKATVNAGAVLFVRRVGSGRGVGIHWWARYLDGLPLWMNEWMNEFVFAPSYRDLSRGCCVSIICLLVQFSFSLLQKPVNVRLRSSLLTVFSAVLVLFCGQTQRQTDTHNHTQTRPIAILTRLQSSWVTTTTVRFCLMCPFYTVSCTSETPQLTSCAPFNGFWCNRHGITRQTYTRRSAANCIELCFISLLV